MLLLSVASSLPFLPSDTEEPVISSRCIGSTVAEVHRFSRAYEALLYSLPYLHLEEIFAVQRVCKSLREAVEEYVWVWESVKVEPPLSEKLTDACLLDLTSKARGKLTCLALLNCCNITDAGLLLIVAQNPQMKKLFVPGCVGLTPTGIIQMVKQLPNLEQVSVAGVPKITADQLSTLYSLLCAHPPLPPRWYNGWHPLPRHMGSHPIDLEFCPKCNEARLVFNCTREKCKNEIKACRGCYFCIQRCEECGGCLEFDDENGEGAVWSHGLCSNCWLRLPKCLICNNARYSMDARRSGTDEFTCADCLSTGKKSCED